MNINKKVEIIKKFLNENYSSLDCTFTTGWYELIDLYGSNNLSQEFRDSMEKEIDSIYTMVIESEFYKKKETRIPALHKKGILCRFLEDKKNMDQPPVSSPYPRHFLRVTDEYSTDGFTDYAITHHDLEIMILDGSAEFIQNESGNFLDYSEEAMRPSENF